MLATAPPAYACVAMSTVVTQGWNVPPEVVAAPLPSPAAPQPGCTLAPTVYRVEFTFR